MKRLKSWESVTSAIFLPDGRSILCGDDRSTVRIYDNQDAMATEKLAEGIRKFYADARKLEQYAQTRMTQKVAG